MFFLVLNIFSRVLGNIGGTIANIIGANQFDYPPPCLVRSWQKPVYNRVKGEAKRISEFANSDL